MYYIIAKLAFEGTHYWPDAPERVSFLRHPHRHTFTIHAKKKVEHGDRDTEFIILKHDILEYLNNKYTVVDNIHQLGSTSCEHLSEELCKQFDLMECSVDEDGENIGGYIND